MFSVHVTCIKQYCNIEIADIRNYHFVIVDYTNLKHNYIIFSIYHASKLHDKAKVHTNTKDKKNCWGIKRYKAVYMTLLTVRIASRKWRSYI